MVNLYLYRFKWYNWVDENKQRIIDMGLDISVIRTPRNIDLEEIYAVRDAVESGFSWYLGPDATKRAEKWRELKDKCKSLTKDSILANIAGPEDLVAFLKQIPEDRFNFCLAWVIGSVSDHEPGNTHLNFDYDMLPGRTIFDSCSWNLRDLFLNCKKYGKSLHPCGDGVVEIDPDKVCAMYEKWSGKSFKLWLANWIGYFSKRVGFNILLDCLRELGVRDAFVDFIEARHYKECIKRTVDETLDTDERLWLVSSY